MTGKNVKERIGLGGMDADRIREIMGEAPACPRQGPIRSFTFFPVMIYLLEQ